jgi:phage-related protein
MKRIEFYKTENGRSPIDEFFDELNAKQMQKVAWTLRIIKQIDIVPKQYFKKLDGTDDLWEVRAKHSNTRIRILGFIMADSFIVLTTGFIKKTKKIPKNEIDIATKRKNNYLMRLKNE